MSFARFNRFTLAEPGGSGQAQSELALVGPAGSGQVHSLGLAGSGGSGHTNSELALSGPAGSGQVHSLGLAGSGGSGHTHSELALSGSAGSARVRSASARSLFDRLAEKGAPLDRRLRTRAARAAEAVGDVAARAGAAFAGLAALARDTVAWETRQALQKLNVATAEDFKILASRLDTLGKRLDELAARQQG
jgi:hypothetical protein